MYDSTAGVVKYEQYFNFVSFLRFTTHRFVLVSLVTLRYYVSFLGCSTHQLVLVGGDGDEDGFGEDEGLEVSPEFGAVHDISGRIGGWRRVGVVALLSDVDARLVFVHTV